MTRVTGDDQNMREIFYARHGQTDWNARNLCVGQIDVPLNETGRQQAQNAAQSALARDIEVIFTSPLLRARETAHIIADHIRVDVQIVDEIKECHLGVLEGQPENDPYIFDDWIGGVTPQGAEPWELFCQRVKSGLQHCMGADKRALIVAHTGVLWAIMECAELASLGEPKHGEVISLEAVLRRRSQGGPSTTRKTQR